MKQQIISQASGFHAKSFPRGGEWSNPARNNWLTTAINDVVSPPLSWLARRPGGTSHGSLINWSGEGWLRSSVGAEALQRIDRDVERFLKNKMSLTDGIELLCEMEQATCCMLLLQVQYVEYSKTLAVRRYLSTMSN